MRISYNTAAIFDADGGLEKIEKNWKTSYRLGSIKNEELKIKSIAKYQMALDSTILNF
jgi:hypothetical protein